MPKSQLSCPYCSKLTDTGHLTEHKRTCQNIKVLCRHCGNSVRRLRDHRCPRSIQDPHPQLSIHFSIDTFNWRSMCPPEFEHGLSTLSSINESTTMLWDGGLPSLQQSKCQPSEQAIYTLVLDSMRQRSDYQVFVDGEMLSEAGWKKLDRAGNLFKVATTALWQATTPTPYKNIYSVLNVWLKDTPDVLLQPPHHIRSNLHLCTDIFDVGINITPKGSYVDLHHDITRRGLTKTFGKCEKVWLLFPPTKENIALYISAIGFENRLARIGSRLQGGLVIKTRSSHELEMPAGTLHAVFTTQSGFLGGINYSTAECLPIMSRITQASLSILDINTNHSLEDLEAYIFVFSTTLGLSLPNVLLSALQSWVQLQHYAQKTLKLGKAASLLRKGVVSVNKAIDLFAQWNQGPFKCGCDEFVDNIGLHVALFHKVCI